MKKKIFLSSILLHLVDLFHGSDIQILINIMKYGPGFYFYIVLYNNLKKAANCSEICKINS